MATLSAPGTGGQVTLDATETVSINTAAASRLVIGATGEWTTPSGTSGQFFKHLGATSPDWAALALADLPSQADDTFLGNISGSAGTPTATAFSLTAGSGLVFSGHAYAVGAGTHITVNANDVAVNLATLVPAIDSTSVVANGTVLERAALTGDVTASQNSNATVIANDAVTNAKLANMAQSTIKLRAAGAGTGDPTDGSATAVLDMISSSNGAILARSAAAGNVWAVVPAASPGFHMILDSVGVVTWSDPTSAAGALSLSSTGDLSVVADNDRDVVVTNPDGVGFSRSMARCLIWDDFCSCPTTTLTVGTVFSVPCDTGWMGQSLVSNGTLRARDTGASGPSTIVGQLEMITGASDNSACSIFKGSAVTTRWISASQVQSLKAKFTLASAANVLFIIGFSDTLFGGTDAAYFYFDTDSDTTIHCFSANSGGATTQDTDTAIAPGTGARDYEIRRPTDGDDWEFLIDGAVVATHTTTAKNRGLNLHISVWTRTTAAKTAYLDHVSLETTVFR